MKKKISKKKEYTGVVTPDMQDSKFFLKWVNGWIKTIEHSRGVYYINPDFIGTISQRILPNKVHTQVIVNTTCLFLDISPKEFFAFLNTRPDGK